MWNLRDVFVVGVDQNANDVVLLAVGSSGGFLGPGDSFPSLRLLPVFGFERFDQVSQTSALSLIVKPESEDLYIENTSNWTFIH